MRESLLHRIALDAPNHDAPTTDGSIHARTHAPTNHNNSFDWNAALQPGGGGVTLEGLLGSFMTTGFQATSFAQAVAEVERMRAWRLSDVPVAEDEDEEFLDPGVRANVKCVEGGVWGIGSSGGVGFLGTAECRRRPDGSWCVRTPPSD